MGFEMKKLGDLIETISVTHSFPIDEIIFLNTSDILNGKVLKHEYSKVEGLPGQAKKSIEEDDILYSEIRPKNKRFAYVNFDAKDYVVSTKLMVLRVKDNTKLSTRFLYHYLTSNQVIDYLQGMAESRSGTFPQITFSEVSKTKIKLPSMHQQNKIATFFDDLGERIEVNHKIILKLEQLAQALFKRWFVDFEFPNENGEPHKSSGGEMVGSELGMIPTGWTTGELTDIATLIMGQSPKSETYNEDDIGIPLINGASDFKKDHINPLKYTTDPKRMSQKNDFLFGVRATVGNVTYVDKEYALGRGVGVARANKSEYHEMLYFQLINGIDFLKSTATGSVYINLTKNDIEAMRLVIPTFNVVNAFHKNISSFFEQKKLLIEQNKVLENLRDTLLPKLLSGEIDLPDETEDVV